MSDLTFEKMEIKKRLEKLEETNNTLNESVNEIRTILFGEKGEKGLVTKLNDMISVANKIEGTVSWISKLIVGAIIISSLPQITNFINYAMHSK